MADAPRASARVASKCVELWGCLAYSSNALRSTRPAETITWRSKAMNPLNNHRQSLILGIVVSLLLAFALGGFSFNELGFARWFHIVSGVFWIGLLYYFNVAQTPALADAAADKGGPGGFVGAFTLGAGVDDPTHYFLIIGTGAWLGTIMLFNVWVLIWPNQKKILGVVAATDEEKARARKVAGMASRVNFVLSIPMLMCMAAASHGLPFIH